MLKTSQDKRWAHKIIERYMAGEIVHDYSLRLACEALNKDYSSVRAERKKK